MRYRLEVREGIMPVLLSEDYTYPLPELCKVQQIFDRTLLEDVEGTLKRELTKKEITGKIHPGCGEQRN